MARPERHVRRGAGLGLPAFAAGLVLASASAWAAGGAAPAAIAGEAREAGRLAIRTRDFTQARERLRVAAASGDTEAQYLLGALLATGPDVEPEPREAHRWFLAAAESGHGGAAHALAVLAATADPPRPQESLRWLEIAAGRGVPLSTELLRQGRLPLTFAPEQDLGDEFLKAMALREAAAHDDVVQLATLATPARLAARDAFDRDALALAATADAARAVAWLLERGVDVKRTDASGATALMLAAAAPQAAALPLLLAEGAEVQAADGVGSTALHYAARRDDGARIAALVRAGAALDTVDRQGDGALERAERLGHTAAAAELRRLGARRRAPAATDTKPLQDVQHASGEDLYTGLPDLHVAATRRDLALLDVLLDRGESPDRTDSRGASALHAAIRSGNPAGVQRLIAARANANLADRDGERALDIAVRHDASELVDLLLRAGAQPGAYGAREAPLAVAIRHGAAAIVRLLLAAGAPVTAERGGDAPLLLAARLGRADFAREILARGAAPATQDATGRDALMLAAASGNGELLQLLLDAGLRPQGADKGGLTALHSAAAGGYATLCTRLLAAGAAVDARGTQGETPLMLAAALGHRGVLGVLLGAGARVDLQDELGDSALIRAAREDREGAVRALLQAGADRKLRNEVRTNAADVATAVGALRAATLLTGR